MLSLFRWCPQISSSVKCLVLEKDLPPDKETPTVGGQQTNLEDFSSSDSWGTPSPAGRQAGPGGSFSRSLVESCAWWSSLRGSSQRPCPALRCIHRLATACRGQSAAASPGSVFVCMQGCFFSRLLDDKEAEEVRISVVWVTSAL